MMLVLRTNLRVLRQIAGAADCFRQGEYDVRIQPAGVRELRQAATIFNNMAERIPKLLADVSDSRRKLHEQLHFIEELIEARPLPMFYKDRQGLYLGVKGPGRPFSACRAPTSWGGRCASSTPSPHSQDQGRRAARAHGRAKPRDRPLGQRGRSAPGDVQQGRPDQCRAPAHRPARQHHRPDRAQAGRAAATYAGRARSSAAPSRRGSCCCRW